MSKEKAAIGLALGLLVVLVVLGRDAEVESPTGPPVAAPVSPVAGLVQARQNELELAVTSAMGAAECGYSDVGYSYRAADDAAIYLVDLMNTASAPLPGDPTLPAAGVDYVAGPPQRAWQISVRPDAEGTRLLIEGFGSDLVQPLVSRQVPCS